MPSGSQDRSFAELMQGQTLEVKISNSALDEAIEWIAKNLSPDDIFSTKELENWAESNNYIKE